MRQQFFGLTVVVPHYNRPVLLSRAIESVVTKQPDRVEIIVVDDASDHNPASAIPPKNSSGIPIRLFVQPRNRGPQAARNLGIRRAKYQYIAFLDSDDEFFPEKVDVVLATLLREQVDILFHSVENLDKYNRIGRLWSSTLRSIVAFDCLITILNPVVTPALVIRRVNKLGVEKLRYAEDWAYLLRYVDPSTKVLYIDNKLTTVQRAELEEHKLSNSLWKMRRGEFAARKVLLRTKSVRNAAKWIVGTIFGLARIFADIRKL